MKNAQDLDRCFSHPVKNEVVSKQEAADIRKNLPTRPAEKRIANQFPGPEPQVVNIPIRRQFIVFGNELPNLHEVILRGLGNLEFHPERRFRPSALTSFDTVSSHSER